ncbi:MAG: asparaginase [Candidatus Zixiibacteriota bacterium]
MNDNKNTATPFVPALAARVFRGDAVEAIHYATIAIVNAEGKLTHYLGDPFQPFMTRSSIKPFQLAPLITTGAADHYKFSNEQLAIMAGSHSGTDAHRVVVMSNLQKAGNKPEMLQCGAHPPIFMQQENIYPRNDEDKDPVRHNCSGKHSGFLALARFMGVDVSEYLNPESKSQKLVKKTLAEICEYPEDKMTVGIDGCSAPNFSLPMNNLALGFRKLAHPNGCGTDIRKALDRIRNAMQEHPFMFSGDKRPDLVLMYSFPHRIVCKGGAEAVQAIGFSDPPLGIAIKIHDGNARALMAICVEVLKQLGIVANMDDFEYLIKYEQPEVRNNRGLLTGYIKTDFVLKKA